MKQKILLTLLIVLSHTAFSQTGVKLYGYLQEILPGIIPRGVQENGRPVEKNKNITDYRIYISAPGKSRIYPVAIWLEGKQFSATWEKARTPIELKQDGNNKKRILVGKTANAVLRIIPAPPVPEKKFPGAKAKAASNELVVVYKLNGKFYTATMKKLVRLEPVNNE